MCTRSLQQGNEPDAIVNRFPITLSATVVMYSEEKCCGLCLKCDVICVNVREIFKIQYIIECKCENKINKYIDTRRYCAATMRGKTLIKHKNSIRNNKIITPNM